MSDTKEGTATGQPTGSGLKVGLELHQQVKTSRKLFCQCPTMVRDDEPDGRILRQLRPTRSEMGEVDPAALFEFKRGKRFYYEYYKDTTCLVETDEEPPHDMDEESIDTCLTTAEFLGSHVMDEIHPMRKIVIDGSNTTGFQRTAVVAMGGEMKIAEGKIRIQTICLEEDAARKTSEDELNNTRTYRLDRLGIPLVEIATAPDIKSASEAQAVALALGLLLRSTGRVKRGLGTIRQDVNVSISGGAVIEIKGLQQLEMLATVVEFEEMRQTKLLEIRNTLVTRGIGSDSIEDTITDVSGIFDGCESKVIRKALSSGGVVYGVRLSGFAGLLGVQLQPDRRFGTELSDYAKFWSGVGGIFHTDELPKYGITEEEVQRLRTTLGATELDAVVIVAADAISSRDALTAVIQRAREATRGIPAETRMPLPDGTTKYARPRPGAERMYPETDVRPVKITESRLRAIRRSMPETLEAKERRFIHEFGLSQELAAQMVRSTRLELFERILNQLQISPTLVAVTLENTLVSLNRDGVETENLTDAHLFDVLDACSAGRLSPEAIPDILTFLSKSPESNIQQALDSTGMTRVASEEVERVVQRVVRERTDFIESQGARAAGGLMGIVMAELKGKADGKTVKRLIDAEIARVLSQTER